MYPADVDGMLVLCVGSGVAVIQRREVESVRDGGIGGMNGC